MGKIEGGSKSMSKKARRFVKSKSLETEDFAIQLNQDDLDAIENIYEELMHGTIYDELREKETFTEFELVLLKGLLGEIIQQRR